MQKIVLNKKNLFVGKTGTGKTTLALKMVKKSGKRLIVVDVVNNPAYISLPKINLEDIATYSQTKSFRIVTAEPEKALQLLDMYHANAFVICEDCGSYMLPNLCNEVTRFLKYHRHRNFDLIMMFHNYIEVPPGVCRMWDYLIVLKTDLPQQRLSKFANWDTITQALSIVNKHKSYNHYLIIENGK